MIMESIMVSIVCITFNHKDFIKKALESLLAQKTSFRFEIIVHDDCSTDGTDIIIREYEKKYPNIVKPIYEKENQYSKGFNFITKIIFPKCKGKYLAYCEGDDYWTDSFKLQKQVDYLEMHPECSLCIHGAEIVTIDEKRFGYQTPYRENCLVEVKDILLGRGGFIATNSIVAPMALVKNSPVYLDILAMDWVLQMYFASQGSTFYFSDIMSVYRKGGKSSWSFNTARDLSIPISFVPKYILVRELFDESTNYKYHDILEFLNGSDEFRYYLYEKTPQQLWSKRSILASKIMPKYEYYNILIKYKYPSFFRLCSSLKLFFGLVKYHFIR